MKVLKEASDYCCASMGAKRKGIASIFGYVISDLCLHDGRFKSNRDIWHGSLPQERGKMYQLVNVCQNPICNKEINAHGSNLLYSA